MGNRNRRKDPQQRQLIAENAAKIMAEEHLDDFLSAKRKAAARLGLPPTGPHLPSNQEIEEARLVYSRLFQKQQPELIREQRRTALKAMRFLSGFDPRLVGPVLHGTSGPHTPISLTLCADPAEEVGLFLEQNRIPHRLGSKQLSLTDPKALDELPCYRFLAGEHAIELVVFPHHLRQRPRSPVDGRPGGQVDLDQLESLLENE